MKSLLELTLQRLEKSTVDTFPDTKQRQHKTNTVNVVNIKYLPYQQSGVLKIQGLVTSGGNRYHCSLSFSGVYYEPTDQADLVTFTGADNKDYHIHPIDETINDVQVSCTCMDFYYRFAQPDYQNKALDGNPPPTYVKKTNKEPVNPDNAPGICKHLMKMKDQLHIDGLIQ